MSGDHADVVRDSVAWVAAEMQRNGSRPRRREIAGMSNDQVSRLCRGLDEQVGASPTFEPGEAGDPAVILSWTAAP